MDFYELLFSGSVDDALAEWSEGNLREKRDDIDAHGQSLQFGD